MQLWLLEIQRRAREVVRVNPLLAQLDALDPSECDWRDASFQSALVARVLQDEATARFAPNRFDSAFFWRDLLRALKGGLAQEQSMHPQLEAKLEEAERVASTAEAENLVAGWYRNYEVCDDDSADATTSTDGPTGSVLALPSARQRRVYPFRVETGCMAASIGLVMWPAGFLLAEWALEARHAPLLRGKRVLELGAGIGLTSVFLARATRPAAVIATDFDVRALRNIQHNFHISQTRSQHAREY